jgi:glycosyltransferase involved in cell wall biosynthesis
MTADKDMLSVAMCTYNGGRFVGPQLQSIANQSRLPDELIVCDDGSMDQTPDVVESFASSAGFPVRLHRNERNLGSTRNFEQCIAMCAGRIIALCDQDDLWHPQKLALLEQALRARPAAGLVFSDAQLVDQQLNSLPCTLWQAVPFPPAERRRMRRGKALDVLLRHNVVTGATMAFRADFRNIVLPIANQWVHDAWIALLISAVAEVALLPQPLLQYRQHARQQIGEQRRGWREQLQVARRMDRVWFEREAAKYQAAAQRLADACPDRFHGRLQHRFAAKLAHQQARLRMRQGGSRTALAFAELIHGRYRDYSLGWKSLAQDLFL